jgi:phage shock protein PspC (stress-responsive transcriptional regulator)
MNAFGDTTQDTTPQDTIPQDTDQDTQSQRPAGLFGRRPLRRAVNGRMLAGVCAGIADYLAVDVTIVRVAFAVFSFLGGAGIPAYLACLLLIPEEGTDQSVAGSLLDGIR